MQLVLASASPRRLSLLRQIGVEPDLVVPTNVDETNFRGERAYALAQRLAHTKALKATALLRSTPIHANAIILAADTVVSIGRLILNKPKDVTQAGAYLRLLSGSTHKVHTGLCVMTLEGQTKLKTVETRVRFLPLSTKMISCYLACREWEDKAGGYAVQGLGGSFVRRIVGSYSNIVGLPLAETVALLTAYNYPVFKECRK